MLREIIMGIDSLILVEFAILSKYTFSNTKFDVKSKYVLSFLAKVKGSYADHILIPQGSTGSSTFFDIK